MWFASYAQKLNLLNALQVITSPIILLKSLKKSLRVQNHSSNLCMSLEKWSSLPIISILTTKYSRNFEQSNSYNIFIENSSTKIVIVVIINNVINIMLTFWGYVDEFMWLILTKFQSFLSAYYFLFLLLKFNCYF